MRAPIVIAGGSDSREGRGVLALVPSEEDDDVVIAMYGADANYEDEDPPFSIVVSDEELLDTGTAMIRLAQERIKKAKRNSEGRAASPG